MNTSQHGKAKLVGINHVALEVGDIDQALEFYAELFEFKLRGRGPGMAFIDMGDQFIALAESPDWFPDKHRHFGLVVDDRSGLLQKLERLNTEILPGKGLNFRDPWGNYVQVVVYEDIQFSKKDSVLESMGLNGLLKSKAALEELRKKGM